MLSSWLSTTTSPPSHFLLCQFVLDDVPDLPPPPFSADPWRPSHTFYHLPPPLLSLPPPPPHSWYFLPSPFSCFPDVFSSPFPLPSLRQELDSNQETEPAPVNTDPDSHSAPEMRLIGLFFHFSRNFEKCNFKFDLLLFSTGVHSSPCAVKVHFTHKDVHFKFVEHFLWNCLSRFLLSQKIPSKFQIANFHRSG